MNQDRFFDYPKTTAILTPRELAVVRLLGSGCSYGQVAVRLGISPHTVVSHIKNAYRKLEVHTGAAAVMRAVQLGLLEVFSPGEAPGHAENATLEIDS
jgi:DNA-binding CsgD family transcriptional regulator